jgi:cobalt-zinc-cadmium resistance protein CzcA
LFFVQLPPDGFNKISLVAGLVSWLLLGFFVNPVLYEMVAREGDVLQV